MKKILHLLLLPLFLITSCSKEATDSFKIEGLVRDEITLKPIPGVEIFASAVSGVGFGRNENVGQAITDADGYYKLKLKVFKGAERLDLYVNGGSVKEGYNEIQQSLYPPASTVVDFKLSPTAILKIKFKNISPVSDKDFFYFGSDETAGKGLIRKEICGTVMPSDAYTWKGKDVCGIQTIEKLAERFTRIYWAVTKNNIITNYRDSVYVNRGVINEFSLNY